MMKYLYTLGIIAAVLTFGSVAMAYPTLNAETGIVALPNALTADNGSIVGAADLLFADENTLKARMLLGLTDRSEVGVSLSTGAVDGISISGKYRFTDGPASFNLAGGGSITLANHDSTVLDLYLVATQSFSVNPQSGKAMLGTFGVHFVNVRGDNTLRPFIGAQFPLGTQTELAAELQFNSGDPIASAVIRHQLSTSITGQIGITNATGFGDTRSGRVFIGAQYAFASRR